MTVIESLDPKSLGEAIRAKRKAAGLRIDDAAALCGITVVTLQRLETAKADIRLSTILKVIEQLGMILSLKEK